MSFDYKDFKDLTDRKNAARLPHAPQLRIMAQAAVQAGILMADPNWAVYQQMLQAAVERTQANRQRLAVTLASPVCSGYEQMVRIKQLMAECDGLIAAWTTAIELPKQIAENAKTAQELLDRQVEKYDAQ